MIALLLGGVARRAILLVLALIVGAYLGTGAIEGCANEGAERAERLARDAPRGAGEGLAERAQPIGAALGSAWKVARWGLLALAVLWAALLCVRASARRRRRYVWLRIVPHRSDTAGLESVMALWESWRHQQAQRWYERLPLGQPGLGLAVVHSYGEGGYRTELVVAVEDDGQRVRGLTGALRLAYENVRVREWEGELREPEAIIRLKKRENWTTALRTPFDVRDEERFEHVVDGLVAALETLEQEAVVQLALCPVPRSFERLSRAVRRQAEDDFVRGEGAGRYSEVSGEEMRGAAVGTAWRSLFFCDIRVGAETQATARQIAGVVQGATKEQNELRPRHTVVRRGLYARRIRRGLANPLPSWRRGVVSSAELACLWRLPDPFQNPGALEREVVPVLAPPRRVPRVDRERALLRSQGGEYLGAREDDLRLGTAIVGGQYSGKTSLLLRWFVQRINRPNTAGVLYDPKGDAALEALRHIPADTVVHYIDAARPEAGISPLMMSASPSQIAEAVTAGIVEAYRTDQGEVQLLQSARRFIHQSTMASARCYDPPTFWHLWLLCSPEESVDEMRLKLARELVHDREMAAVALAFQQLNVQLRGARSAMIQRLDSPANKIYGLLDPKLDAVLRHPHQVDVGKVIERREVLIVNGAAGTFGPEYASMLALMVLAMVHRSIAAQQDLPPPERANVALALDEAWMFFSPTLAELLAMDRSAGLLAALAWHLSAQIPNPQMRATAYGLLRNRYFFALEREDARELADYLQPIHLDLLQANPAVREQLRIGPEVLARMPRHWAAVDQYVESGKVDSWMGETIPMEADAREELSRYHLEAQRERGGRAAGDDDLRPPEGVVSIARRDPEVGDLVDALAPRGGGGLVASADAPAPRAAQASPEDGAAAGPNGGDGDSEAVTRDGPPRVRAKAKAPAKGGGAAEEIDQHKSLVGEPGSANGVEASASFRGLARYERIKGIEWAKEVACRNPQPRTGRRRASESEGERRARLKGLWVLDESEPIPNARELEILRALWEFNFLESGQIAHHLLGKNGRPASASTVSRVMGRLYKEGWVRRLKVTTGPGRDPWIYAISRGGFEICRVLLTREGRAIDENERWPEEEAGAPADRGKEGRAGIEGQRWRRSEKQAAQSVLHEIGAAEWTLRFARDLAVNCVLEARGPRRSWLLPPTRMERGERRQLRLEELAKGAPGEQTLGLIDRWGALRPDAACELELESKEGRVRRVDLLVEYERQRRPGERIREKLQNYDAYRTAWWRVIDRYGRVHGEPAIVVVVVADGEAARRYAELADAVMTGTVAAVGHGPRDARYPGRQGVFFCAEADVHRRTLRAYRLDPMPPALRERVARNARERAAARKPMLRQVSLLPDGYLVEPAGAKAE
ncbi:MAG: hypothetical protein GEU88_12870 [Solirubrobacterales bacterium]|nr:hypothetical protein [Solirubrobacterales bacterium]